VENLSRKQILAGNNISLSSKVMTPHNKHY